MVMRWEREWGRADDLFDRYQRTGNLRALNKAVASYRRALAALPTGGLAQAALLQNFGAALQELGERTGDLATITEAVQVGKAAVAATPTGHPHQAGGLNNLGTALQILGEWTRERAALTEAVQVGKAAVAATPTGHPHQAQYLNNLGNTLKVLFKTTGERAALTEAVQVGRAAVAATPTGHPNQAGRLHNLGVALQMLVEGTKGIEELATITEAVQVARAAVAATPTGHPDQAMYLNNLGTALRALFERTRERAALTEAVQVGRAAVAATPAGHPERAGRLNNLAGTVQILHGMQILYGGRGESETLDEAVQVGRAALTATPTGHSHQAGRLNNLGTTLRALFERTRERAALTAVVQVARAAVAATPTDHPDQASHLNNLGAALRALFERTEKLAVLTEAVQVTRAAVAATPTGHPNQAMYLINLGNTLRILFEKTGKLAALTKAGESFADAAASPAASIPARIAALFGLGEVAMLASAPGAALAALEAMVELVPQLAPRAFSRPDREHGLGRLSGLASEVAAVAVAAGHPNRAVELLEQTRGLLIGEAIDARSDVTELRRAAPGLAAELDSLREQVSALEEDDAASPAGFVAQPTAALSDTELGERRRLLAEQWKELVDRIRATAGFEQFLRPPPITGLQRQASAGPIVVVYVSRRRADALIMTADPAHPVQVVPLPALTTATAVEQVIRLLAARAAADDDVDLDVRERAQREVHAVLGWLWDTITGPVLDHLGITGGPGPRPRIWWCPVGVLAYLPLHAAGHHIHTGATPEPRTVLDRAVFSYTITLRALEHARATRSTALTPTGSAVIIAMPTTPGAPVLDLPGVDKEVKVLARLLGSPVTLIGVEATHQAVTGALPSHRIAHFACHGLSDRSDPAGSRLLLHDHDSAPLTVTALMRLHLADADLAYLSVCSTTETSLTLTDEAVHLTAAVHLAGYRHVIGTLWPINDTAAARIATDVYTRLTNGGTQVACTEDSAYALAEATRGERDAYPKLPTRWAAHLHLGP